MCWVVPTVLATSDELGSGIMTDLLGLILEGKSMVQSSQALLSGSVWKFANILDSSKFRLSFMSR